MASMEEELRLKFGYGEGPLGLIVVPSRELAQQIFDFSNVLIGELRHFPKIRTLLCIGGTDMKAQLEGLKRGAHILISTPGRLSDLLSKGKVDLSLCKMLALDEADRLLDLGFEEEVENILRRFRSRPQVVLCSAAIPRDIQLLAGKSLRSPVVVSLSRLEVTKLNIIQQFVFPRAEDKLSELLSVMSKTQPPILIFCENKADVEEIVEILSKQGIKALAVHGGKEQSERSQALEAFRRGSKEVLVATDVVAKGLHFQEVKHVINFDLPKELDLYIQRICRTGSRETGLATTLISSLQDQSALLELRWMLEEAKQELPSQLRNLRGEPENAQVREGGECAFCGLKGHRKSTCYLYQIDTLSSIIEAADTH